MRFRNLYQTDFAPIQPRPELLEAARALYQQPKPRLRRHIRASALGLAACLLLAVGLCQGLPGNENSERSAEDSGSGDQLQMARSLPETAGVAADADSYQPELYQMEDLRQQTRMASRFKLGEAGQADSLPKTAETQLCALPLATMNQYDSQYDCANLDPNDPIIEYEYSAKDQAPNPFFAAELLRPQAPDSTAYLAQCGLWLVRYTWYK